MLNDYAFSLNCIASISTATQTCPLARGPPLSSLPFPKNHKAHLKSKYRSPLNKPHTFHWNSRGFYISSTFRPCLHDLAFLHTASTLFVQPCHDPTIPSPRPRPVPPAVPSPPPLQTGRAWWLYSEWRGAVFELRRGGAGVPALSRPPGPGSGGSWPPGSRSSRRRSRPGSPGPRENPALLTVHTNRQDGSIRRCQKKKTKH